MKWPLDPYEELWGIVQCREGYLPTISMDLGSLYNYGMGISNRSQDDIGQLFRLL